MIGCRTLLDVACRDLAEKLGRIVARSPSCFILLPLCAVCAALFPFVNGFIGALGSRSGAGAIHLFTPEFSDCTLIRDRIQALFPDGGYFADRTLLAPNLLIAIVEAADSSNVLQPAIIAEYERLRRELEGIVVEEDGSSYNYLSLCENVAYSMHCRPDAFLTLTELWNRTWISKMTYPLINITIGPLRRAQNIGPLFGGVELNDQGEVEYARFVRLIFNLPPTVGANVMDKYEKAWTDGVNAFSSPTIVARSWSSRQYDRDMRMIGVRTMRLVPLLLLVITLFSVGTSVMRDPVLSKPLLALSGVISAGLAIVTAHGLLFVVGVPLIQIALITPFLVLSIGIDDMFIMINVWRKTNTRLSVEDRMACTYREAAVAILLTRLTDVVVFMVGVWSPFPAARIFCIHCCVSISAVFIFQITLFGACMGLDGGREGANRHCLTMKIVQEKKKPHALQALTARPCAVVFFKDFVAPLFDYTTVQLVIIGSYIFYVAGVVLLLETKVEQGLELSSLLPDDTKTYDYLKIYERYFATYSTSLEVVISNQIDYTDYGTQVALMEAITQFENTPFTLTADFWLRDFLYFTGDRSSISSPEFHTLLANGFLKNALFSHYAADMVMMRAPSGDVYINTSRFFIGLRNVDLNSRSSAMRFNAGVFALLAAWDTRLDIISSITILLSIGYSIDFGSHVVYHFMFVQGDGFVRLSASLETMAWPVVQASLSTLFGVACVAPVHGYVAHTFVKTVFIVCAVGLYHCLLLLPVILIRTSDLCRRGDHRTPTRGIISAFEGARAARSTAVVRPVPQEADALRAVWVTCDGRLCDRCQPELDCHQPTCGKAVSLPDIRESAC
uniref:SSD domain-containing protein n=1 Tax=Plectus sambesii TaxID=2011161 RepID=A0A914WFU1_9BILA